MKINSGNSHVMFSENNNVSANIDDNVIISQKKYELLAIISDSKSSFEGHIINLCKTISRKLKTLSRLPHTCVREKNSYEGIWNLSIWVL